MNATPADYDAWYATPRGRWISDIEFHSLWRLLSPRPGDSMLDAGCGTGHFTRRFQSAGLRVTGLDKSWPHIAFAQSSVGGAFAQGSAEALPFSDKSFDYCVAVTSLCFVANPAGAVKEMARVARKGLALGLLNTNSLLYLSKSGTGGYAGARWDTAQEARQWIENAIPCARAITSHSVFIPSGGMFSRVVELVTPSSIPLGGFIAIGSVFDHLEGVWGK
ncbi:MAG: methyltransferase domain-containing protein [Nitrospinae bacterium]|nr:methyltransferase domain-containing protein [Nitrospinota bacterium]